MGRHWSNTPVHLGSGKLIAGQGDRTDVEDEVQNKDGAHDRAQMSPTTKRVEERPAGQKFSGQCSLKRKFAWLKRRGT